MKKGETIETLILPEEVIQQIQFFMSGKEAARSAILSKSWYDAWLTCQTIDLDQEDFYTRNRFPKWRHAFGELAQKTIQRYEGFSLKIENFSLRCYLRRGDSLTVNAMKLGATHLQLEICWSFPLPQEVLGSETLLKLSLSGCEIYGNYEIRCSRLKSLSLERVKIKSESFKDIMISCCNSLEELLLTSCYGIEEDRVNLNELRKLRRLYLRGFHVDSMFFTDLASRFPCLKDLTIHHCNSCTKTHIAWGAEIDVPNIRKVVYSWVMAI